MSVKLISQNLIKIVHEGTCVVSNSFHFKEIPIRLIRYFRWILKLCLHVAFTLPEFRSKHSAQSTMMIVDATQLIEKQNIVSLPLICKATENNESPTEIKATIGAYFHSHWPLIFHELRDNKNNRKRAPKALTLTL
ncbi:hypothetical protein RIF29_27893 [Crotalaria pallida]|uniref:Uncharacterized protein n=1 Tax=Crotalaria pallida TaxID=3830 RepID=A0AAN9I1G0_CROPI